MLLRDVIEKTYNEIPRSPNFFSCLSAPNENLTTHVQLMLESYIKYRNGCGYKLIDSQKKLSNKDFVKFIIFSHDLGKINAFFQARMNFYKNNNINIKNNKKTNQIDLKCLEYSYHSFNSLILGLCILYIYFDEPENLSDFLSIFRIYIHSILNHHTSQLKNVPEFNIFDEFNLITNFTIDDISDQKDAVLFELFIRYLKEFFFKTENNDLKEFINNMKGFIECRFFKALNYIIENCEWIDLLNLGLNIIKQTLETNNKSEEYLLILYYSSILIDLDVWAAKKNRNSNINRNLEYDRQCNVSNSNIIDQYLSKLPKEKKIQKISEIRTKFMNHVFDKFNYISKTNNFFDFNYIFHINAPTGTGKTLVMLKLAMDLNINYKRKIIYVLPFVSICEQLEKNVFHEIFNFKSQTDQLTVHHYLASNVGKTGILVENDLSIDEEDEVLYSLYETSMWRSDFIITTTVTFFETIFKPFKENVSRFNRLANSIVIWDEYHTLPIYYQKLVIKLIKQLTTDYNVSFILGTATTSGLLDNEVKQVIDLTDSFDFNSFDCLNRYTIKYHSKEIDLNDFIREIIGIIKKEESKASNHVMIVLNTKSNARYVFEYLSTHYKNSNKKIYHLSTNVIPVVRRERINEIINELKKERQDKQIILVTTQLIEAGVDISFNRVIRDMGPVSSIVQVAGRCNREGQSDQKGYVDIYKIRDSQKNYIPSVAVYGGIDITISEKFFKSFDINSEDCIIINESIVRKNFDKYIKLLKEARNNDVLIKQGQCSLTDRFEKSVFKEVNQNFKLIDEQFGREPVIIIPNNIEETIKKNIIDEINYLRQEKFLSSKLYPYIVNVRISDDQKRTLENIEIKKDRLIFYILDLSEEKNQKFYDTNVGFLEE